MKAVCVSMLLLLSQGIASETSDHRHQNHQIFVEEIPPEFKEFLDDIGFSTNGKSIKQIKDEYAIWIAQKENQDRFLLELSTRIKGERKSLSKDELDALESLRKAFGLWSEVIHREEKLLKASTPPSFGLHHLALSCSKKNCHCCRETYSVKEDIEAMRDEIEDLKEDARDTLIHAGLETAGSALTAASGHPIVAGGGIYFASKDVVDACQKYNEAVDLEKHVDSLERFAYEEGVIDECKSTNKWWEFWK